MNNFSVNYQNSADLTDRLLEFLNRNSNEVEIEVKPDEHIYTYETDKLIEKTETIDKDYSTELDKQLMNIRKKYCDKVF